MTLFTRLLRSLRNSEPRRRRPVWTRLGCECLEDRTALSGAHGLTGQYYNDPSFGTPTTTRTDATVNFNFGTGSPAPGVSGQTFSVRWSGQVQALYTETYTFYVNTQGAAQLLINGQQVTSDLYTHTTSNEATGTIALTAGQNYNIQLDFFQLGAAASASLSWSSASQSKQVIPNSQLTTDTPANSLPSYGVPVGAGTTDPSVHQLVRTSSNVLYLFANGSTAYPSNPGSTLHVYAADQAGTATSFSEKDVAHAPGNEVNAVEAAIDGNDVVHVIWNNRLGQVNYATFDTKTNLWGSVTLLANNNWTDFNQGDEGVALALDASGNSHAFWTYKDSGGALHIDYANNVGGTWSSAVRVDDLTTNNAIHPTIAFAPNGDLMLAWIDGTGNYSADGTVRTRLRHANGTWDTSVAIPGTVYAGLDNGPSLLITADGTRHITFNNTQNLIQYWYDPGTGWKGDRQPPAEETHDPVLGLDGSGGLFIYGHGPVDDGSQGGFGSNKFHFHLAASSTTWSAFTLIDRGPFDDATGSRWSQFFFNYPTTVDFAYWYDNYSSTGSTSVPYTLYVGSGTALSGDVATSGTAYRWSGLTSATSNANRNAAPGLNDGNLTTDVNLNGGSDDISNAYEGAGVVWSAAQTVNQVSLANGSFDSANYDGVFDANLQVQSTNDGTTWTTIAGWKLQPAYPYNSSAAAGTTTIFTGSPITALGVRVVGQVHTLETGNNSWSDNATEIEAFTAVPIPPLGVMASPGNGQATISWSASSGATSYNLYRSTTAGGEGSTPYRTGLTATSFTDTSLTNGTTYYYRISAVNAGGESLLSSEVQVTPKTGLPTGWSDSDIGSPAKAGSVTYDGTTWTVNGGGADIWGTSDQFNFASRSYTGDGSLVARVTSLTNTNVWAKAGVMFRNGSAANAQEVSVFVTPGNGVSFQDRATAGGNSVFTNVTGITAPEWVKLARTGNSFSAYYSSDGVTWKQVGSAVTVSLPTTVQVGLAVTAHDNTKLATATFTNVAIQQGLFTTQTPTEPNTTDNTTYELGTVFQSSVAGTITGIRFYRAASETGTNIGHLWDAVGNLLATVTFTATGSGWVTATFSSPITIQANTNYTISVSINQYFAATTNGLSSPISNGFLTTVGAGVFGTIGTRPTNTYEYSDYFVDPLFAGF